MRIASTTILTFALTACGASTSTSESMSNQLVGTWEATGEIPARVTYDANGTWRMTFTMTSADGDKPWSSTGTWKIIDGNIHSTTLKEDELPGMPASELPDLSIDKIVSLQAHEYRYVCPVQGCINTMRRVDK